MPPGSPSGTVTFLFTDIEGLDAAASAWSDRKRLTLEEAVAPIPAP